MRRRFAFINKESSLLSEFVHNVEPYSPISSRDKILDHHCDLPPLKLDWNEATIPPSPRVTEAITDALTHNANLLNWYPELFSERLRTKLQDYTGRNHNEILVTNGSDDALELICKVFLDPGDQVIVPFPTYTHFLTYVESRGAVIRKAESEDVFNPGISSIISKINYKTKLIYIVNPNNPTGVLLSLAEIRKVLEMASDSIVIVDEAYYEFSGMSAVDLIDEYDNLIVTRTFSKAWAMAGLRVGYAMSNSANILALSRIFNPKSVNVLAQIAASAALDDIDYTRRYINEVTASKHILIDYFSRKGIEAHNSEANYIMVHYPAVHDLLAEMEKENVFVRDRSFFKALPDSFRITLGNAEQTADLISRLDKILDRVEKKHQS